MGLISEGAKPAGDLPEQIPDQMKNYIVRMGLSLRIHATNPDKARHYAEQLMGAGDHDWIDVVGVTVEEV